MWQRILLRVYEHVPLSRRHWCVLLQHCNGLNKHMLHQRPFTIGQSTPETGTALMCLQLSKTMLLKCNKQKTRLLPASTSWFSSNSEKSSIWPYQIPFHPISSYFIPFPRCFTMLHHLVSGDTVEASFLAAAGFCCQDSPKKILAERRGITCIIRWPHYVFKKDLNRFKRCVRPMRTIDIP